MSYTAELRQATLHSPGGLRVELVNVGAAIKSIRVPTSNGYVDVVLGYGQLADYLDDPYFLGATIGRYAGRIARGNLSVDGRSFRLKTDPGAGRHALHGGPGGFHRQVWGLVGMPEADQIKYRHVSIAGEQGFPAALDTTVTYKIVDDMKLEIEFVAVSDGTTVVNLTNHAYFNLNGGSAKVDDHFIVIDADRYTVLDDQLIPTGEIRDVTNTPYDLREPELLRERIRGLVRKTTKFNGFDQNFVLSNAADGLRRAATVFAPRTGIKLSVFTTQPGLQFYTGDCLGEPFEPRAGLCLEAQRFPDAPNHAGFPSTVLHPGDVYSEKIVYAFDAR